MRLIDADEIEELFREVIGGIAKEPEMTGSLEHMVRASAMVIQMLQDAPTVDAVPVRHGKWIRVYSRPGVFKYLGWTCDQCGYRNGNEYAPQWHKFCPGCGARMDGDGNG